MSTNTLIDENANKAVELEVSLIEATKKINDLQQQVDEAWNKVKVAAIDLYKQGAINKTETRPWGSFTITETDEFTADVDKLPKALTQLKPNMAAIKAHYHLYGRAPVGAKFTGRKYGFSKRIKTDE